MVDHLREQYRASERQACRVLLMVRGTYRYQSHPEPWTELRMRIREIAQSRVRYGYRKIRVLLNREGWNAGKYLVYRLYKEEGLALKKRPQRRRKAVRHREEKFVATAPNQGSSRALQSGHRRRRSQSEAGVHCESEGKDRKQVQPQASQSCEEIHRGIATAKNYYKESAQRQAPSFFERPSSQPFYEAPASGGSGFAFPTRRSETISFRVLRL